jgi:hypothetical protein
MTKEDNVSGESEKKVLGMKPLWLAIAATVIVLAAAGAYFTLGTPGVGHKTAAGGTETANAEPAPNGACGTALARVRDYGVVPYDSTLSSDADGKKTADGRVECAATNGDQTYSMTVNLTCDNLSDPKCLEIYRVTQGDGNALFQKRPYSF